MKTVRNVIFQLRNGRSITARVHRITPIMNQLQNYGYYTVRKGVTINREDIERIAVMAR